ncbi:hypothetical protein VT50_0203715 [Streptomyces antioxidans]|uniref:Uncharacterized protein n=1 Tax=Streptomyces antioxidans TaxID=1507734 RepID=A0A1V4DC87_9ACTN|nr:hypothetical protein [Streptomyces antioxidans]OPF83941.1 hypothetical protein VT50_0203715 [Streptomyces antioxidans]
MTRNGTKARRLVVGGDTFLWSLRHTHRTLDDGRHTECCETLVLRLFRARGELRIAFRGGPGRTVPGGFPTASGMVGTAEGGWLNLHEPGTARALLDEARARGWRPDDPTRRELDGWALFAGVEDRRGTR